MPYTLKSSQKCVSKIGFQLCILKINSKLNTLRNIAHLDTGYCHFYAFTRLFITVLKQLWQPPSTQEKCLAMPSATISLTFPGKKFCLFPLGYG